MERRVVTRDRIVAMALGAALALVACGGTGESRPPAGASPGASNGAGPSGAANQGSITGARLCALVPRELVEGIFGEAVRAGEATDVPPTKTHTCRYRARESTALLELKADQASNATADAFTIAVNRLGFTIPVEGLGERAFEGDRPLGAVGVRVAFFQNGWSVYVDVGKDGLERATARAKAIEIAHTLLTVF